MINYLKERVGLIFFYSVIVVMILLMNARFTDLNTQKNIDSDSVAACESM